MNLLAAFETFPFWGIVKLGVLGAILAGIFVGVIAAFGSLRRRPPK